MLPQFLILLGILVALWLAYDWFTRVKPRAVARAVTWLGLAALVVLGLWLVLTGKLAGLFAVAVGLSPWLMRAARLHALWRVLRQFGVRLQGGQASPGHASVVETRFLRMELDHDSGRLDGEIIAGPWRGRRLSGLDAEQVLELRRQTLDDPDTTQVLDAWIERTWPDRQAESPPPPPPPSKPGMTIAEAREILGVGPAASPEEIRAAHRKLMLANHPDHGGSSWIAARINQARDLLLG